MCLLLPPLLAEVVAYWPFFHLCLPLWFSISYNMFLKFVSRPRSMCWCPSTFCLAFVTRYLRASHGLGQRILVLILLSPLLSLCLSPCSCLTRGGLGRKILDLMCLSPWALVSVLSLACYLLLGSSWCPCSHLTVMFFFCAFLFGVYTILCKGLDWILSIRPTLGNPGMGSALRRSYLLQTLFESQLARKQAVWQFSEFFSASLLFWLLIAVQYVCFGGFEAAWQCACWNGLANLSMLS